jgi:hypothetical protein
VDVLSNRVGLPTLILNGRSADGVSIQRIPVRDNVYADRPVPHGVVAIAPENAAGVWLSTCGYGKNSLPMLLMRC